LHTVSSHIRHPNSSWQNPVSTVHTTVSIISSDTQQPSTNRKAAPRPQPPTPPPQNPRHRHPQHNRQPRQQRIPPSIPEHVVHPRREQREAKPGQTPQHVDGAERGRGVARVGVDEVDLRALEADDHAGGVDEDADVGGDPVGLGVGCPAVDEEAEGDEGAVGEC